MRIERTIRDPADYIRPVTALWSEMPGPKVTGREAITSRDYFRSLRAAEMEAWELTGGDYMRSAVFAAAA